MNQGGIKVDDQRVGGRGQPGWVPWPGRSPDFGAQAAGHGGEPVGESIWLFLNPTHEPADRRIRGYEPEELRCGAQLVDVCGLLTAGGQGQGQGGKAAHRRSNGHAENRRRKRGRAVQACRDGQAAAIVAALHCRKIREKSGY